MIPRYTKYVVGAIKLYHGFANLQKRHDMSSACCEVQCPTIIHDYSICFSFLAISKRLSKLKLLVKA